MILTQCPVCAAPLPPTSAKQCSRCKTRYCGPECQKHHWEAGGHDKLCKLIRNGGGAEQYHADKKYSEAVTVAAEACAEDTKGQTCYICTQALHWKTKEGLVRGCACRGTAGFAHVSCLAEQAKILVAEAEENNLGDKAWDERWKRWHTCSLCEQEYHGVVRCALGWACWKTYVGRPEKESDWSRRLAITQLGNGLYHGRHYEDAVSVKEVELAMERRLGAGEGDLLAMQGNLAVTYQRVGRFEDSLSIWRDTYTRRLKLSGKEHIATLRAAFNYANFLNDLQRYAESKSVLCKVIPVAKRAPGEGQALMLKMKQAYASALCKDPDATLDDLREAVTMFEEIEQTARRVFGGAHPFTAGVGRDLRTSRAVLADREGTPPGNERP